MAQIIALNTLREETAEQRDPLSDLTSLFADDMRAVNQLIIQRMDSSVPLIAELASHIIAAGGKRLRPMLVIASSRLCGDHGDRPHKLAAALEFIHTATLLHDDVVDASDLRRGTPSANAVFGNQPSILVGDFLYSRSFQLMVEDGSIDVLRILSNASSVIAEGEVIQLTAKNDCTISEQTYLEIIQSKTAELFAAACRMGAVIAGRSSAEEEALRTFGLNLGIAFQIIDDVLDYSAEQARLGKAIGDDFREGKITLPVILAIHRGNESERAFWQRTMSEQNQQDGDLAQAQGILMRHNTLQACVQRARHYASIARDSLGLFADSRIKTALINLLDFTIQREF